MLNKIFAGYISVDSGLIGIGDPCYHEMDDFPTKDWNKFCDTVCENDIFTDGEQSRLMCFSTICGDGDYPVYVNKDKDGKIIRVIIELR